MLPATAVEALVTANRTTPGGALQLGGLLARGSSQSAMTVQSLLAAAPPPTTASAASYLSVAVTGHRPRRARVYVLD